MSIIRNQNGGLTLYQLIQKEMLPTKDPALKSTKPPQKNLHPSSSSAVLKDPISGLETAIGTCLRKAFYSCKGYQEDVSLPEPRSQRLMAVGETLARQFLYDPAKKLGLFAAEELQFYDEKINVSGRIDLMCYLPGTSEKIIVECKSISPNMIIPYIKAGERGYTLKEPRWYDLCQLMTYMQYYKKFDVQYGAMYYISRDMDDNMFIFEWANVDSSTKEIPDNAYLKCHSDERTWDLPFLTWGQIKDRYHLLQKYIDNDELPPRDYALQYSNDFLAFLSQNVGKGSQFIDMNKTDAKAVETKLSSKKYDPTKPIMMKGSFNCDYCPYKERCWFNIIPEKKTAVQSSPIPKIVAEPVKEEVTFDDLLG